MLINLLSVTCKKTILNSEKEIQKKHELCKVHRGLHVHSQVTTVQCVTWQNIQPINYVLPCWYRIVKPHMSPYRKGKKKKSRISLQQIHQMPTWSIMRHDAGNGLGCPEGLDLFLYPLFSETFLIMSISLYQDTYKELFFAKINSTLFIR